MNNDHTSRLALTSSEKATLRSQGIKLKDIASSSVELLRSALKTSTVRAMEIKALSEFESIPSVGSKFAHDLVSLGYYSLDQLKNKKPAKLYGELELMIGAWADPCLEDQFRLVVHYANNPTSKMNWWDFTTERKKYREKHGYSSKRPVKPWYELEQYKKINKVPSKSAVQKKICLSAPKDQ